MTIRLISVSRRTDIPAFYGRWFMNRVRAGFCAVPNPFNSKQISRVEINPTETLIVFWTRWAAPFLGATDQLQRLGYRFYFQYTLVNNPTEIDPKSPSLNKAITVFRRLADRALIIDWSTVAKPPQGRDTAASPGAVVVAPVERARACARAPARTRRGGAERRSAQRPWCHRAA